jgi:hypothetical protein
MDNGQVIKTQINGVPVELLITSIGPAAPSLIAEIQSHIAEKGVPNLPSAVVASVPAQPDKPQSVATNDSTARAKSLLSSRTLWFNAIAIGVAILAEFGYTGDIPDQLESLVPAGIAIVNIIIRLTPKIK